MGRIEELILCGTTLKASVDWHKHLLIWERVQFISFRLDDCSIELNVEVKITGSKGFKKVPGWFKAVPLQAVSPGPALEDSCRLILYLAIIEDHIAAEGINGLASIQIVRSNPHGTLLVLKESSSKFPVFRRV